MNLILDDSAERRLNVMTGGLASRTAQKVADFLGVPVLWPAAMAAAIEAWAAARKAETTAMPKQAKPAATVWRSFAALATVWRSFAALARLSPIPSPVVIEPRPDLLVIRPRLLAQLAKPFSLPSKPAVVSELHPLVVFLVVAQLGALAPLPLLLVAGLDWSECAIVLVIMFAPSAVIILLTLVLYRRARFDRTRGELTVGWRGAGRRRGRWNR